MFSELFHTTDPFYQEAAKILDGGTATLVGDGDVYTHTEADIRELQALMYTHIQAKHIHAGINYTTLEDVKQSLQVVGDEFLNPTTGVGTFGDPAQFTHAIMPVMTGPMEQSAIYASGGLAALIIDKKSKGMVGTGVTFKTFNDDFWLYEKVKELEEAAELTGLNAAMVSSVRDALVFGGTTMYPLFKGERLSGLTRDLQQMTLEKNCIDRWITADRWNVVYVPSYILTAEDYLKPKTIYLPLGGYAVSTTRTVMLRPKTMPYWALLYNMGWSPSDFTSYIRSVYAYQMVMMSVPIMAQQMSLVLYQMPLDAITAQMGPETVKKLMMLNEEKMSEWSILHPKAVNMVGEVTTVERTFSGFDNFIGAIKSNLAAECGIPEPSLWHTPNKGFSDNTTEALLKDSEMMKLLQRSIEPQLVPSCDALIAHVYGTSSEEWNQRHRIWISFDQPMVSTEKDLAEIGARFAATVASLVTAQVPAPQAIQLAQQFFKTVQVRDDQLEAIEEEHEWQHKLEEEGLKAKKDAGTGHSIASPGSAANTGSWTKGKSRVK